MTPTPFATTCTGPLRVRSLLSRAWPTEHVVLSLVVTFLEALRLLGPERGRKSL